MKAAVFRGPGNFQVEERPDYVCGPEDVICRVLACGICGSDLHGYKLGMWAEPGWTMGHEVSLQVAEVGAEVTEVQVGDRVFPRFRFGGMCGECFWCKKGQPFLCEQRPAREMTGYSTVGGYSEYIPVRDVAGQKGFMLVPDSLPADEAAFVEPLFGAMLWVAHADPQPGDVSVIIGAGTIGLMCLQLLKLKGSRVIVVEPSALRRNVAALLGADVVVNPRDEDPLQVVVRETRPGKFFFGEGGAAADIVMECAGKEQTLDLAMDMARMGGKVVLVALYEERTPINPNRIIHKDLKLISSFGHATAHPFEGETSIDLLASGRVQVAPLITHRFPLDQINEAFDQQLRTDETIKVLIEP